MSTKGECVYTHICVRNIGADDPKRLLPTFYRDTKQFTIRKFVRGVKADGIELPVTVIIVRRKVSPAVTP